MGRRDDGLSLHGRTGFSPGVGAVGAAGPLGLLLPEPRATETTIGDLAATLRRHPGDAEVTLKLHRAGTAKVFEVPIPVRVTADLYGELKGLLGPQCLG